MAATKYQVLYRYVNEATNTPITNSMDNEYETVREFYTDPDHKIFSTDATVQAEATDEQQQMISYGNSSENPKTNMLFAYDGTKKIKHKKWVNETTGYAVRDWSQLKRSTIGNQNDFTKEFTTLNAATPEDGGLVVCTEAVMRKYFPRTITVISDNSQADMGSGTNRYYSEAKANKMITESTFFALSTSGYGDHGQASKTQYLVDRWGDRTGSPFYTGPVAIGRNTMANQRNSYSSLFGSPSSDGLYSSVTITQAQIATVQIPGHYEDAQDAPYLIIDTYKRIQLSPWFVNCTCGSLESALTKARTLVDMLGIENVKLIKLVPFDQFIKIK